MKILNLDQILVMHAKQIKEFGGDEGLRDMGLLESALAMPFQTFDGIDLYQTVRKRQMCKPCQTMSHLTNNLFPNLKQANLG